MGKDISDVKDDLVKSIQSNIKPFHFNAGKTEIMIRCPYCGDSSKSALHTHLYVGLNKRNSIPWYCQKCASSGYVDNTFLKDIGLYDSNLIIECESVKKEYLKNKKTHRLNDEEIKGRLIGSKNLKEKDLILPSYKETKNNRRKYDYLNDRYSFDLSPDEYIKKYKVIFSFKDFIFMNDLEELYVGDEMLKKLLNDYVGFLSSDQSYIIFRNVNKDCLKKERYYMYNIFDDQTGKRFYTINTELDAMTDKITLVLSEGPFDIIGIREYFYKNQTKNIIFASVNGKGYNLVVNYFARLGFLNMDIFIYSDQDVDISKYKSFKKSNPVFMNNAVRVYYNTIEKDCGTKLERIKLKKAPLV